MTIADFFYKRRKTLLWTALGTAAVYALGKFAQFKAQDLSRQQELQRIAQENIKRRFRQNQQDCTLTVLSLLPSVGEHLFDTMNVERATEQLKKARRAHDPNNGPDEETEALKAELWENIKIWSFARTIAACYCVVLLTILVRIQLNIIGRFSYLDSVENIEGSSGQDEKESFVKTVAKKGPGSLAFETERDFLAISWHFINVGICSFIKHVEQVTKFVLADVPLNKSLSVDEFTEILTRITDTLEVDMKNPSSEYFIARILLPSQETEAETIAAGLTGAASLESVAKVEYAPAVCSLVAETRSLLASSDCQVLVKMCMEPCLRHAALSVNSNTYSQKQVETMPLASLLPHVNRLAAQAVHAQPNKFLRIVEEVNGLDAFAAIVYSSFAS